MHTCLNFNSHLKISNSSSKIFAPNFASNFEDCIVNSEDESSSEWKFSCDFEFTLPLHWICRLYRCEFSLKSAHQNGNSTHLRLCEQVSLLHLLLSWVGLHLDISWEWVLSFYERSSQFDLGVSFVEPILLSHHSLLSESLLDLFFFWVVINSVKKIFENILRNFVCSSLSLFEI